MIQLRPLAILVGICLNMVLYKGIPFAHATNQPSETHDTMSLFEQQQHTTAKTYLELYLRSNRKAYDMETIAYYKIVSALAKKEPYTAMRIQHFCINYPNSPHIATIRYRLAKLFAAEGLLHKSLALYQQVNVEGLMPQEQEDYHYALADVYLQLQDWPNAQAHFAKINHATHPCYASSQLYMAYIASEKGNFVEALAALQTLIQHKRYGSEAKSLTLQIYHKIGDFESLLNEFTHDPDLILNKKNRLFIADAYFFLQKYQAAITHYQAYLNDDFTDRTTVAKLAYALYATQQYPQSLSCFQQLYNQEDLESQIATYYSGLIYEAEGAMQEAINIWSRTIQQKFDTELHDLSYIKRAALYYRQGALSEVMQSMHNFIQENQASKHLATAQYLLITCWYQTKAYSQAIEYITSLPYTNEVILNIHQKILFHQGLVSYNQGNLEQALTYLQQSLDFPFQRSLVLQAQFWLAETLSGLEMYHQALKIYTQLMEHGSMNTLYHTKTLYGLAYSYFNTGNYTASLRTFKHYLDMTAQEPTQTHYDAMLRLGDCYYVKKDYAQALELYAQSYAYHPAHVRYQEAVIYQILGDTLRSEACLQEVIAQHSTTKYYEQACYHAACTSFNAGQYETAIQKFSHLIAREPNSRLQPELLMKRALSYENLHKTQEACRDYIAIIDQFPTHMHAESALMALTHLFAVQGKSSELNSYLQKHKRAAQTVDNDSDLHTLNTIKKLFYSQAYTKVLQELSTFCTTYPKSKLLPEVYFLMAESHYRLKNVHQALSFYKRVVASHSTVLHTKAWLRIADLTYLNQQFQEALSYYQKLQTMQLTNKAYERTLMGIVKTSFALKQYKTTTQACMKLLNNSQEGSNEMIQQAHGYLGKISMQRTEYKNAKHHFSKANMPSHTVAAAEAQYLLAYAEYKCQAYHASLQALFALMEKFPHHINHIDDAFLLMADNYMRLGNAAQAKVTLNSIIKRSKCKKTIALAKKKRGQIREVKEEGNSTTSKATNGYSR